MAEFTNHWLLEADGADTGEVFPNREEAMARQDELARYGTASQIYWVRHVLMKEPICWRGGSHRVHTDPAGQVKVEVDALRAKPPGGDLGDLVPF